MHIEHIGPDAPRRVAVIYQALQPPVIGGLRKEPKPGGYSDSGADIAFCLRRAGCHVVTPAAAPDPADAMAWVFPDTEEGLRAATAAGATVIWANTVLFAGHPLENHLGSRWIVGQLPARQEAVDDKFATNALLHRHGLPVARSLLVAAQARDDAAGLDDLTDAFLSGAGLRFPLVVKPVRGRGSQGVTKVDDAAALRRTAGALVEGGRFGDLAIVEQYLPGEELTVTVLPGGAQPLVLPPVRRFNHADGIAPYNGTVAVVRNSAALTAEECRAEPVQALMRACADACTLLGALAPIRIDCRADAQGRHRLFDLNMKPNMTGAGRPGREDQDSLSALAARAAGWRYADLLLAMLERAWRREG